MAHSSINLKNCYYSWIVLRRFIYLFPSSIFWKYFQWRNVQRESQEKHFYPYLGSPFCMDIYNIYILPQPAFSVRHKCLTYSVWLPRFFNGNSCYFFILFTSSILSLSLNIQKVCVSGLLKPGWLVRIYSWAKSANRSTE